MQHTSEQHDAIHIQDKNLLVVAGAGSGKTRVLVERYVQLLADNPDWPIGALVAITFTRAAAFEMRQRLREELEQRAGAEDGEHWAHHLAQMDSARIDTIHGLCADILRANAAQAGVDPKFEVLDETEAAILLDEVVADELAALEPALGRALRHLRRLAHRRRIEADEPRQRGLSRARAGRRSALSAVDGAMGGAGSKDERQRLLDSELAATFKTIGFLPANDKLAVLADEYLDNLERIEAADLEAEEIVQTLQDWHKNGAVGTKGSVKAWGSKEAKAEVAQTLRDLRDRIKETLDAVGDPPGEVDRRTAAVLHLWYDLLTRVRDAYRQRKAADARLDFDDLERLAAQSAERPVRARALSPGRI